MAHTPLNKENLVSHTIYIPIYNMRIIYSKDADNAQSEEDNGSLSDHNEAEEEIQQHSESEVNHEVENSNQQHHDDSIHQQPLSCDRGKDHDGQEDGCVDGDLPFSCLDYNSLVEEVRDVTQHHGNPAIQNTTYHQVLRVDRKRKLSSGDI